MILCWVLYSKGIIGVALPIITTVFFGLEILCGASVVNKRISEDE